MARSRKIYSRRWLRNFLAGLLALQLVGLVLWGVFWPQSSNVTIAFVVPEIEQPYWEPITQKFEATHPTIDIQLITGPYTTEQREAIYSSDFQNPVAQYDLVYADIIWVAQFAPNLQSLTPFIEQNQTVLSDFLPSELAAGSIDAQLYRMPMRSDIGLTYYRKNLLPEGIPDNRSAITTRLSQLPVNAVGYLWQGQGSESLITNFMEVLSSFGGSWIDRNQQVGLDQPAAVQAAGQLRDLIEQKISPATVTTYAEEASLDRFQTSNAAILRGWPYFWQELQAMQSRLAIGQPLSLGDQPAAGCRGGWGFAIPKNAAHPEVAWQVLEYLTSAAVQKEFTLASGFLPSRRSVFTDATVNQKYPFYGELLETIESRSVFRPAIAQYREASAILQRALSRVLRGEVSAEQAMQTAANETRKLGFK